LLKKKVRNINKKSIIIKYYKVKDSKLYAEENVEAFMKDRYNYQ